MKTILMLAMFIIAMGLIGCPHYHDRDDRNYDHRHDYQQHDRDNPDHEQDHEQHRK